MSSIYECSVLLMSKNDEDIDGELRYIIADGPFVGVEYAIDSTSIKEIPDGINIAVSIKTPELFDLKAKEFFYKLISANIIRMIEDRVELLISKEESTKEIINEQ